jgi:cell division protein FtsB
VENHPFLNNKTFVYFENVQKIKTQKDKKLESLEAEVQWLKSELAKYKRKVAFLEESSGEI